MSERTSFVITNWTEKDMCIQQEPEGFEFMVPPGENITIETSSGLESVKLRHSIDAEGLTIGVINDNNDYRILYKGKDVFEGLLDS